MSKIYYELQRDCSDVIFSAMKNPVGKCVNNCWFCSRSNKFLDIKDYHIFNINRILSSIETLKDKLDKKNPIIFDYGVNFTHTFDINLIKEFEYCINLFIENTKSLKNIYFRLCIVDDLLLKTSVDNLKSYLDNILPIYNRIPFKKEIKMSFSFDFDSRLTTKDRGDLFLNNYKKMLALQNSKYGLNNNIRANNLVTILLAKTVKFVNNNWNNDNFIINTFKQCIAEDTDVAICLPWPMSIEILKDKKNTNFCKDYCYLNIKELLRFNELLDIKECPYIIGKITEGLFFCELNGGCKNKYYCKQYLLGNK